MQARAKRLPDSFNPSPVLSYALGLRMFCVFLSLTRQRLELSASMQ